MTKLRIPGSMLDAEGTDAFSIEHHFRKLAREARVPMTTVDRVITEAKRTRGMTLEEALSQHLTENEVHL